MTDGRRDDITAAAEEWLKTEFTEDEFNIITDISINQGEVAVENELKKMAFIAGAAFGRKQALEWVCEWAKGNWREFNECPGEFIQVSELCEAIEQQLAGGEGWKF